VSQFPKFLTGVVTLLVVAACGHSNERATHSATPVSPTSTAPARSAFGLNGTWRPDNVGFPPRNLSFDFRLNGLETKYRDGLRRSSTSTFVDPEGDVVWTQEYIRYRVNGCDHQTATLKVFTQIDGGGTQPECRDISPSGAVPFPPRNESYDFRVQLEAKYRDQLRRPPSATFVDPEGSVVWTQEYLRYMVNGCDHVVSMSKVFDQIDGRGIQPVCTGVTCTWQYRGADLDPSGRLWSVAAAATTKEIIVSTSAASCAWSAGTSLPLPNWITVTPQSGAGSGRITVSIAANTSGSARDAQILMDPPPTNCSPFCGIERTFTVHQSS
jgi:Putative binding domain, N-terminal